MPAIGDVHYGIYDFKDGGTAPKFLVVLYADEKTDRIVTCIVTSKTSSKDRNRNAGCQFKEQRFFIPANADYFELDSFVQLLRFKEFTHSEFLIQFKFAFPKEIVKQIKDCLKKLVDDIPSDMSALVT